MVNHCVICTIKSYVLPDMFLVYDMVHIIWFFCRFELIPEIFYHLQKQLFKGYSIRKNKQFESKQLNVRSKLTISEFDRHSCIFADLKTFKDKLFVKLNCIVGITNM